MNPPPESPTKLSWLCGRTPTPTSRSTCRPKRSTPIFQNESREQLTAEEGSSAAREQSGGGGRTAGKITHAKTRANTSRRNIGSSPFSVRIVSASAFISWPSEPHFLSARPILSTLHAAQNARL